MTEEAQSPGEAPPPTRIIFGITVLIAVVIMAMIGFMVLDDIEESDSAATPTASAPAANSDNDPSAAPALDTVKEPAASTNAKQGEAPPPPATDNATAKTPAPSEPEPSVIPDAGPRWVKGERYTYNVSYETHVDYFSGDEVGKKTLTRAQGTLVIGVNSVLPDKIRAEYSWNEETYFANGLPNDLVERVREQARSPVYVTLSPNGQVTHIDFPPTMEQATTLFVASLVMEFQLVLPSDEREHWEVSELDTIGKHTAIYTRGHRPRTASKRKENYTQFTGIKSPEENRLEQNLRSLSWHGKILITPNGWVDNMDYEAELSRQATATAPRIQGKAFGSLQLVSVIQPM